MKQSIFSLVAGAAMLLSCGSKDSSLIGQLDITPMVNPNVGILVTGDHLDVTLTGEQTILGVGSGLIFETSNGFNSFRVSQPYENDLAQIAYLNDNAIVCYQIPTYSNNIDDIILYRTTNKGETWQKKTIPDISTGLGTFEYMSVQFINANQGFILVYNWGYSGPYIAKVYTIDLDAGAVVLVGQCLDGYQPVVMKFLDASNGIILFRSILQNNDAMNTWMSRTTNGGVTWSTPTSVDLNRRLDYLEIVDPNTMVIFGNESAFHSSNGGTSFQEIKLGDFIMDLSFVNASTGYSVNSNGMVSKSTNGGLSWSPVGEIGKTGLTLSNSISKIHFYNEQVGIVSGTKQLYMTKDGGQSWAILIYPFNYVTGM